MIGSKQDGAKGQPRELLDAGNLIQEDIGEILASKVARLILDDPLQ